MARRAPHAEAHATLRNYAMRFPASTEDHPWGETAIKVKGKVFVFLSRHKGRLYVTTKLPVSGGTALGLPFAEPTGYGLGKHGWVTASFAQEDAIPVDLLREWIDESYRAVAPRSVLGAVERDEESLKPKRRKRPAAGRRIR